MKRLTVEEEHAGLRVDKFVAERFTNYSRASVEKLVNSGGITVNGHLVKTKYTTRAGDVISLDFSTLDSEPETAELVIVYEDDDVLVINKPVGLLAHSKGAFSKEATVATSIQPYLNGAQQWKSSNRAGIVHRLDRATSGIMICAKNEASQIHLQKQFAKRNTKKTYLAVVRGEMPASEGVIDVPIERNPKKPATFKAGANGKSAQTGFTVSQSNGTYSLVELRPVTGRTHQLRVHLKYLKRPIVGDEFYDGEANDRLLLHAWKLEVTLPSSERRVFESPVPAELLEKLA